ncbi:MAG: response regulator [Acidobacteria bacterium]|nr:response regulator [Acidobacteriota bacterium]
MRTEGYPPPTHAPQGGLRLLVLVATLAAITAPTQAIGQEREAAGGWAEQQQFIHETWTVRDGLPVNSINALLQSQDGYIWAATFDGLVRFDGVRFTVYSTASSAGLPSNRILSLLEARNGDLWLTTEQGHLVRHRDGRFTHFDASLGVPDPVIQTFEDSGETIWVGHETGVARLAGTTFISVGSDEITGRVTSLAEDTGGALWAGTAGGQIYRLSGNQVEGIHSPDPESPGQVRSLSPDQSQGMWGSSGNRIFHYRRNTLTFIAELPARTTVSEVRLDPADGTVRIVSSKGVFLVRDGELSQLGVEGSLVQRSGLMHDPPNEGDLIYGSGHVLYRNDRPVFRLPERSALTVVALNEIAAVLRDHEGSIWLGTAAAGLHRLKPALFSVYGAPEGINEPNIYGVLEDQSGAIWLGTWGGGVARISGSTVRSGLWGDFTGRHIQSLLQTRAGTMWFGGMGAVSCAIPDLVCDFYRDTPVGRTWIRALHEDDAGRVWFGTDRALIWLDGDQWRRFSPGDGAPRAAVRVFQQARDGALWMGTNGGGLARYLDGEFLRITTDEGLPSDLIRSLYEDGDGSLWVGTEGRGLARLRTGADDSLEIIAYREANGLFDEVIHQILEDDFGRLWMNTNRGIFWVPLSELNGFADGSIPRVNSTSYNERDGLRNREGNGGAQPAGAKTRDGRLWFPTQDGVVVVDPASLSSNQVPPPVVIETVNAGAREIATESGATQLQPHERSFQIDYTALSFLAPENVRFRYLLEGYDSDWIEAGSRRTAFFTQVPPGTYTFRVSASNNADVWNETGASAVITVAPYFYETMAARLAALLALLLVPVIAVWWRVRDLHRRQDDLKLRVGEGTAQLRRRESQLEAQNMQLEAQAEDLAELDRAKSRFFANVSHEFRTPLTLTVGPLEDLRSGLHGPLSHKAGDEVDLALRNAKRLLRLVNQVLDVARLEAGEIRPRIQEDDLNALVRGIGESFAALAERRDVQFEVLAPEEVLCVFIDPDLFEKVLMNLLSNAFKFTAEGGSVRLSVELSDAEVAVSVRDNGPGIGPDDLPYVFERFYQVESGRKDRNLGSGIGLSLAHELIELHGGRIEVESEPGFGSTFRAVLRLGSEHLDPWNLTQESDGPSEGARTFTLHDVAPATSDAPERVAEAQPDDDERATILLVEDNPEVRSYVRRHLEPAYRLLEAANGETGLSLARDEMPDLILSDLMMPGMDGLELCAAVKADPALDFIPVILLTAKASGENRLEGLRHGADDYVTKPFDFGELEARIENLIASRTRLRDRLRREALLTPELPDVRSAEDDFVAGVIQAIEGHIDDDGFGVEELAEELGFSRASLYRRLESLIEESPAELIHRVRLDRAAQLLAARAGNISEIAYAVGYKSVSHFGRRFRERFRVSPSAFCEARDSYQD